MAAAAALRRLGREGPRAVTGCGAVRAADGSVGGGVPVRAHRAEPPPVPQGAAPRAPPDAVGRRDVPADAGDGAAARESQQRLHRGLQQPRVQHQRQRGGRALRRAAPRHPPVERECGSGQSAGMGWGPGRPAERRAVPAGRITPRHLAAKPGAVPSAGAADRYGTARGGDGDGDGTPARGSLRAPGQRRSLPASVPPLRLVAEILVLGTGDRVEQLHPTVLRQMRLCGIAVEVQDTVRRGPAPWLPSFSTQ